jgi:hypothetical protein
MLQELTVGTDAMVTVGTLTLSRPIHAHTAMLRSPPMLMAKALAVQAPPMATRSCCGCDKWIPLVGFLHVTPTRRMGFVTDEPPIACFAWVLQYISWHACVACLCSFSLSFRSFLLLFVLHYIKYHYFEEVPLNTSSNISCCHIKTPACNPMHREVSSPLVLVEGFCRKEACASISANV